MDQIDPSDVKCEVVYDVTNIEELEHFDIGDDTSTMEMSSEDIDVMQYMEHPPTLTRSGRRTRRPSNRIIHILPSRNGRLRVAEAPPVLEPQVDIEEEQSSEVIMTEKPSLCRVFVTSDDSDHHTDGSPLFSRNPEPFAIAAQIIATEAASIDSSRICTTVPQEFTGVGTFVVDMQTINNRGELSIDGLGSWTVPQGSSKHYKLRGNHVTQSTSSDYSYKILCNRYTHQGTDERGNFHKKIYTGVTAAGEPSSHAVIVYEWVGEPHPVMTSASLPIAAGAKERAFGTRTWEGRLENLFQDECLNYRGLPVFSRIAVDFETACRILLSSSQIQESRICTRVPQVFEECGTFVLDVARCGGERMLSRDGRDWNKPSGSSRFFRYDGNGNAVRADVNNAHPGDRYDIQVMLKRYETIHTIGLYRKLYVARDRATRRLACPLAVLTYTKRPAGTTAVTVCGGRPVASAKKRPYPTEGGTSSMPGPSTSSEVRESSASGGDRSVEADDYEMFEIRRLALEKQMENQNRFGMLLDRAESFLDRFEQSGSQILVPLTRQLMQVWRGEEGVLAGEEVVVETEEEAHHLLHQGAHLQQQHQTTFYVEEEER